MKFAVNKRENNNRLILFFLGWASDENTLNNFDMEGYDIVSLYDYRDLALPAEIAAIAASYKETVLLAWSFGVLVADRLYSTLPPVSYAVAINGTPLPVDDSYGIPERSFALTLRSLPASGIDRFNARMCGSGINNFTPTARPLNELTDELGTLCDFAASPQTLTLPWNVAIVGEGDLIFPVGNMIGFWNKIGNFAALKLCGIPHYPFGKEGIAAIREIVCGR